MPNRPRQQPQQKNDRNRRPPEAAADDFVSVARRLECDEDKATFEAKLAKIAKAKPKV
jgi:hypothetical protein